MDIRAVRNPAWGKSCLMILGCDYCVCHGSVGSTSWWVNDRRPVCSAAQLSFPYNQMSSSICRTCTDHPESLGSRVSSQVSVWLQETSPGWGNQFSLNQTLDQDSDLSPYIRPDFRLDLRFKTRLNTFYTLCDFSSYKTKEMTMTFVFGTVYAGP